MFKKILDSIFGVVNKKDVTVKRIRAQKGYVGFRIAKGSQNQRYTSFSKNLTEQFIELGFRSVSFTVSADKKTVMVHGFKEREANHFNCFALPTKSAKQRNVGFLVYTADLFKIARVGVYIFDKKLSENTFVFRYLG